MPAPVDLTGRRFGGLLALQRARGTGRSAWVCLCDCGRETTVPTNRLSSVADDNPRAIRACETCRSRACVVCGTLYLKSGSAKTCGSDYCRREHRRASNQAHAALAELRNPGQNARRQQRLLERWRTMEPDRYIARLERGRMAQRRRRAGLTDAQRAAQQAARRAYYAANRERIRDYFHQWVNSLPPDRRIQWNQRAADAQRAWRARKALALMLRQSADLLQRMDHEPDNTA